MKKPIEGTIHIKQSELLTLLEKNRALDATYRLYEIILESLEFDEMTQKIADLIPQRLGYETGVLALINEKKNRLERVAISQTIGGEAALKSLEIPFNKIIIPMDDQHNICIKAIKDNKQYISDDLYQVLRPVVSEKNARLVQKTMGTKISVVTPLKAHEKIIGIFIVSISKQKKDLSDFEKEMIMRFSEGVGVAIENSKLYTDLKDTTEDLHKAYKNLKELDRLKDEFLSVTSHELRTPMTIIKSYLWMLKSQKSGGLKPKQEDYIDKALNSTERMLALINDMLNISRVEQGRAGFNIKKIELVELLQDTLNEFKPKAQQKGVDLNVCCKDEKHHIYADDTKLREIVLNLVSNALKFTLKGSINIELEDMKSHMKVKVIDTGAGIVKDDLKRLFHKFGRLDNSYQTVAESGGTGLGLYIVKLYVEGMGGMVGAESEGINKGSTFWFTLPKNKIKIKESLYTSQ